MEELGPKFLLPELPYDVFGNFAQPHRSTLAEFLKLLEDFDGTVEL